MPHFVEAETNGLCYFHADHIPFPHGFSTRAGGVSAAPHLKSLNLGYGRGEGDATVKENWRRFLGAVFGEDDLSHLASSPQIHSAKLSYAEKGGSYPEGDGFFTDRPGVILSVKIADCQPILLADPEKKIIAALHAGWRGTAAGIALRGVEAMVSLGASPKRIVAAIGPSIGSCCYEVGEDFVRSVAALQGEAFAAAHIVRRVKTGGAGGAKINAKVDTGADAKADANADTKVDTKVDTGADTEVGLFADLSGMNRELLLRAGLSAEHILLPPACTACFPGRFFSHRASGGLRGTMAAVISL